MAPVWAIFSWDTEDMHVNINPLYLQLPDYLE